MFFKFVRINYAFPFIQKMMKNLQCHDELYTDNISNSSSENGSLNDTSKRLKVECTLDKQTVYTGKECLTNLG